MAVKQRKVIALDSCVLIDILQSANARRTDYQLIAPMMKKAENDEWIFLISTLAIAELVKINGIEPADQRDKIVGFLENDYFEVHAVDRTIAQRAQDLRREHPLDTTDSVHIATALITNTHLLLTRDGDSKKLRRKMLPLDNKIHCADGVPLRIMTLKGFLDSEDAKTSPLLYHNQNEGAAAADEALPDHEEDPPPTLRFADPE